MDAQLQFDLFTDDEILFATKDAANNFFSNIRVPGAAIGSAGVVQKAQLPDKLSGDVSDSYNQFDVYDDQGIPTQSYMLVKQETVVAMVAKITSLQSQLNNIRQALIDAGVAQ